MYFSSFLRKSFCAMTLLVTLHSPSAIAGVADCGRLENHFGPLDYRSAPRADVDIVERYHFTPKVQSLIAGSTSLTPGGDLGYTLKVFPNHHRALMVAMQYAEKAKKDPPPELAYSIRCWFDRAERFRPDDGVVQALYGTFLIRNGNIKEGLARLEHSIEMDGGNGNIHYIVGLAYFDAKIYDKSLESAHRAYQMGFALPGLKNKLKKIGKWTEPPPAPAEEAAREAAAAAEKTSDSQSDTKPR